MILRCLNLLDDLWLEAAVLLYFLANLVKHWGAVFLLPVCTVLLASAFIHSARPIFLLFHSTIHTHIRLSHFVLVFQLYELVEILYGPIPTRSALCLTCDPITVRPVYACDNSTDCSATDLIRYVFEHTNLIAVYHTLSRSIHCPTLGSRPPSTAAHSHLGSGHDLSYQVSSHTNIPTLPRKIKQSIPSASRVHHSFYHHHCLHHVMLLPQTY